MAEVAWTADARGCKVINMEQRSKLSVSWSGACVGGFADGVGELRWFRKGRLTATFAGKVNAGQLDGSGDLHYANGDRYQGGFFMGRYEGKGAYTFADGARYEGTFSAGRSTREGTLSLTNGVRFDTDLISGTTLSLPRFIAPPALFAVCFNPAGQFVSSTMVRKSGVVRNDEIVTAIVKVRALGGEELVGEPIPGCHMVGVGVSKGEYVVFYNGVLDTPTEVVVVRCRQGCDYLETGWLP
jgi:hypothetical protein